MNSCEQSQPVVLSHYAHLEINNNKYAFVEFPL